MTTVYAVASAKGGVGKTTTTAAMATILARSGADVVAIDADIGMANLAGALGVTPGETTLHDVLAGRAEPLDAVHEGPEGLRVVPGADDLDAYASADPAGLADAVAAFEGADYVFVDAGAGLSHDSSLPLAIADETLLVSTAERSALGDTEKTRQLAERLGGTVAGAAITRVDPDADPDEVAADGLDDIADILDATVLGRIPEDDAVVRAATANRPLATFAPDAPATRAYRDLTRALTGATVDGPGLDGDESGDESEHAEPVDDEDAGSDDDDVDDETDDEDENEPDDETEAAAASTADASVSEGADDADDADGDDVSVTDAADEDIIVADAEAGGLSDPGDEEEIIVADEAPVPETAEEPTADREAADVGTETVGEEHVDGDDLEAMIEEDIDEAEAFEGTDAAETDDGGDEDDEDSVAADDESAADGDATDAGPADDPDDELAGSVPFRDDDTGARNTVLAEDAEGDGADEADETNEGDREATDADETDEGDEKRSGGFFSRLFGR